MLVQNIGNIRIVWIKRFDKEKIPFFNKDKEFDWGFSLFWGRLFFNKIIRKHKRNINFIKGNVWDLKDINIEEVIKQLNVNKIYRYQMKKYGKK